MEEQLRLILEAEAEGRRALEQARRDSELRLWEAEEQGRRRVAEARAMRETITRAAEEALVAEARAQAEQIAERGRAKAAAMRALAEPRMDRAVERVLRAVLGRDDGDER